MSLVTTLELLEFAFLLMAHGLKHALLFLDSRLCPTRVIRQNNREIQQKKGKEEQDAKEDEEDGLREMMPRLHNRSLSVISKDFDALFKTNKHM